MSKKLTADEFIAKANEIHNNKYAYHKVLYLGCSVKVTITCPIHGDFEQTPGNHYKYGCSKCAGNSKKSNTEFIEQAIMAHSNKYDYSLVNYLNYKTKVFIVCKEHGEFEQRPDAHLTGQGCAKCGVSIVSDSKRYTNTSFIEKANTIHNSKYDYSETSYLENNLKVTISCSMHGNFEQTPNAHLQSQGCPKCGIESSANKCRTNVENFIMSAKHIHSEMYDYSMVEYKNTNTKVTIVCSIHGPFEQTPSSHLQGCGCSSCAKYGFQSHKPAILYYLKIVLVNRILYKIGITNKSVNERFQLKDLSKIEVLKQKAYDIGLDAYKEEQRILKYYSAHKYQGPKVLESHGNTELFNLDISLFNDGFNNIFL